MGARPGPRLSAWTFWTSFGQEKARLASCDQGPGGLGCGGYRIRHGRLFLITNLLILSNYFSTFLSAGSANALLQFAKHPGAIITRAVSMLSG